MNWDVAHKSLELPVWERKSLPASPSSQFQIWLFDNKFFLIFQRYVLHSSPSILRGIQIENQLWIPIMPRVRNLNSKKYQRNFGVPESVHHVIRSKGKTVTEPSGFETSSLLVGGNVARITLALGANYLTQFAKSGANRYRRLSRRGLIQGAAPLLCSEDCNENRFSV